MFLRIWKPGCKRRWLRRCPMFSAIPQLPSSCWRWRPLRLLMLPVGRKWVSEVFYIFCWQMCTCTCAHTHALYIYLYICKGKMWFPRASGVVRKLWMKGARAEQGRPCPPSLVTRCISQESPQDMSLVVNCSRPASQRPKQMGFLFIV